MKPTLHNADRELLQKLLLGQLPSAEAERLAAEYADDGRLGELAASLAGKDDTLLDLLRNHDTVVEPEAERLVERLLERLQLGRPARPTAETAAFDDPHATSAPGSLAASGATPVHATLEHYRLVKVLGQGGMGTVYLAEDTRLRREVALKTLRLELAAKPQSKERFLREARLAASIEHDNIVQIYHVGEDRGIPFLAMQLLKGTSLEDFLKRCPVLKIKQVLRIGIQIAVGLAAAHQRGMIHRDIKPGNIWIEPTGGGRVKILDFGLARISSGEIGITHSGTILGTPAYMSPEQARGEKVDSRCDLYSLGCVLYRMATGELPITGTDTMAMLMALALNEPTAPIKVNPQIPQALSDLIMKLLAKDPSQRVGSAMEVAQALKTIDRGDGAAAPSGSAILSASMLQSPSEVPRAIPVAQLTQDQVWSEEKGNRSTERAEARLVAPSSHPVSGRRRVVILAAVGLLALIGGGILFGGQIIRVVTNKGELIIVVEDPTIDVKIVQNSVVVQDKPREREFTLTAGDGEIEVLEKNGIKLTTKKFELIRGRRTTVTVTLKEVADVRKIEVKEPNELVKTPPFGGFINSLGMEFARVPKGKAWLGGGSGKVGDKQVEFKDDFYLGVYEVTQEEWQKAMGSNPSYFTFGKDEVKGFSNADLKRFPAEGMSWDDCLEFVARLNANLKENGWVYRLPTEAQWEYACRGGRLDKLEDYGFDFYLDHPTNTLLPDRANFNRLKGRTCKVGSYPANRLGLHDMHGNVWEWCHDSDVDAQGTAVRMVRGGGWHNVSESCSAAQREKSTPTSRGGGVGLRLARVPAGVAAPTPPNPPEVKNLVKARDLDGHKEEVISVGFSADGRLAITGSWDKTAGVWDVETGKRIAQLVGHTEVVTCVALSSDGRLALTGSADKTVGVWEVKSGQNIQFIKAHTGTVRGVAFAPDDRGAVSGGEDHAVFLLSELEAAKAKSQKLSGHTDKVMSVAYAAKGDKVLSGGWDATARLWDVTTGQQIRRFIGHSDWVQAVAISPDGKLAVTGSGGGMVSNSYIGKGDCSVRLWNVETGEELKKITGDWGGISCAGFLPDSRHVFFAEWAARKPNPSFHVWDTTNGWAVARWTDPAGSSVVGAAVASDGKYAVVARAFNAGGHAPLLRLPELLGKTNAVPSAPSAGAKEFTNALGMKFALVPKGKALLSGSGGKVGDKGVEIPRDFYLGVYEVTQHEWQKIMNSNPSSFSPTGKSKDLIKDIPESEVKRFPVHEVSWDDCQEFITRLNEKLKESGWEYRLPTQVQWEYACRGGPLDKEEDYGFDYYLDRPTNTLLPDRANFDNAWKRPCKVGSFPANRLGLHDMHGNVAEWCADSVVDDQGVVRRVTRGGGWHHEAGWCRAVFVIRSQSFARFNDIGLRLALVPVVGAAETANPSPPRVVDLLKLVDVKRDAVKGDWTLGSDGLTSDGSVPYCRLKLPYRPPAEYDFRVEFTAKGGNDILHILSAGDRSFTWLMGAWGGKWDGFDTVIGHPLTREGTKIIGGPTAVKRNVRHTSVIQVRKGSITALMDGKLVVKHPTDFSDLGIPDPWKIGEGALGVGTTFDSTVFHTIEVTEISSTGSGAVTAPDLRKAKVLFKDDFASPQSQFPTGRNKWANGYDGQVGYESGRYFVENFSNAGYYSPLCPVGYLTDFAVDLSLRVTGSPSGAGALWLSYPGPGGEQSLSVSIHGDGKMLIHATPALEKKYRVAPDTILTHAAIKGGPQFNKLLVICRKRTIEVYVNGVAVCQPLCLAADLVALRPAIGVRTRNGPARAEFERLTIYSAEGLGGAPPPAIAPFNGLKAKEHQDAWAKHLGVEPEITNTVGIKMRIIPPGTFLMGSPEDEAPRDPNEGPRHEVTLTRPFAMSAHEITQEEFHKILKRNPSFFSAKGPGAQFVQDVDTNQLPADSVSRYDAVEFCIALSKQEGRLPCYALSSIERDKLGRITGGVVKHLADGEGYRLPTEAEWEFACRAGTQTPYSFGAEASAAGEYGWFVDNGPRRPSVVGAKKPNAFGLFDMHGNLAEWCHDLFRPYQDQTTSDPVGKGPPAAFAVRGGSFSGPVNRSAQRSRNYGPGGQINGYGFRVVLVEVTTRAAPTSDSK